MLKKFRLRCKQPKDKQQSRTKNVVKRPKPAITPAKRQQIQAAEESDKDILIVNERVDIDSPSKPRERGILLQKSTRKPAVSKPKTIRKPDPVPANSTDTTKRIVRVVHQLPKQTTLNVTVVPKTNSIGVQVGSPTPGLGIKPIVVPAPEPPLKSYWTHHINLPYPPTQTQEVQPAFSGQYVQQQQQRQPQYHYYQQSYAPSLPYTQQQFGQAVPFNQPFVEQHPPTRRQKRNYIKHQKYLQRRQPFQ